MARFERTLTIDHEIGPAGELRIRTIDGHVRIRGTDATVAHVLAHYHVRAADQAAADRAIEAAEARVERLDGRLEIDTHERWWSPFDVLGQLLSGTRVKVDFDVEVPRGAFVQVEGVSAEVSAEGLRGRERMKTVSGDFRTLDCAGPVDADSVSGRIEIFGPSTIEVQAHTVSGRIQVAANDLARVKVGTTSGGVDLAGRLAPGVDHAVNTVSGGVRLATDTGVTVELRTMSGSVRSQVPHRVESTNGGRRVVVGDGLARLRIQAVSGGLEVMPQRFAPTSGPVPAPAAAEEVAPAAEQAFAPSIDPVPSAAPAFRPESAEAAGEVAANSTPDPELEVLRALERGAISVEDAATRLSALRDARLERPTEAVTNDA